MQLVTFTDYEDYRQRQTAANKKSINRVWVIKENILFLSGYIRALLPSPKFGLCHGTRRGNEQQWFREYLRCEVLGTEISDTATDFPYTIQWDFHEVKPEWLKAIDFIYSNSIDHSYDPQKCLQAWMSCLKPEGLCILEHSWASEQEASRRDPFRATVSELTDLIKLLGFKVRDILVAPVERNINIKYIIIEI